MGEHCSLRNTAFSAPSDRSEDWALAEILRSLQLSDSTTPSTRTSMEVESKSILSAKSSPESKEICPSSPKFRGGRCPLAASTNGTAPSPGSDSPESGQYQTPMDPDEGEERYEEMDWDPELSFDYSRFDEPLDNKGYEISDPLVAKDEMDWVLTSEYMRNELLERESRRPILHLAHEAPNKQDTGVGAPNYRQVGLSVCGLCGAPVGLRSPCLNCGGDGVTNVCRSHRGRWGGDTGEFSEEDG
ncbi:hypothetical protein HOY80DRAFT_986657 [Tuber brumale]|nr:hypothetical protein HOY80DRAFT_986657 [Tuber brumale]